MDDGANAAESDQHIRLEEVARMKMREINPSQSDGVDGCEAVGWVEKGPVAA